jgi:hypothetical protein
MIVTGSKKPIPVWWIVMITMPVFADSLSEWCGMTAMTFSIRKSVNDPRIITLLHSFNFAFNFMVVPVVAWYSDRIWTPLGRRKPFILAGWAGMIVIQIALPGAPNIWILGILIIGFHFLVDCAITGPFEPLIYEVIPVQQRGLGGALRSFFSLSANMFFSFLLIGMFDSKFGFFDGVELTGEHLIYWTLAAVQLTMFFHVLFNVRETPVAPQRPLQHFSPVKYFKAILSQRQWLLLYSLVFAQVAMIKGLGELDPLLITDQFGYTKQQFGIVRGFVGITQVAVSLIAAVTLMADRIDRLKMFTFGVFLSTLYPITFFVYVKFMAPDQIPPLWVLTIFECLKYAVNVGGSIALMPLLFDFIPRNKMSTLYSGTIFIRGVSHILIVNGMSFWVAGYSKHIAHLPAGQWDYMGALHYLLGINVVACIIVLNFWRHRRRGRLTEYGRMGLDE